MSNRRAELLAGTAIVEPPYSVPFGAPFQRLFGPGKSTQHKLIKTGEIESALVGEPRGRRVIIVPSYLAYLERQRKKEAAGEIGSPSPNPRARGHETKSSSPSLDHTSTSRSERGRRLRSNRT